MIEVKGIRDIIKRSEEVSAELMVEVSRNLPITFLRKYAGFKDTDKILSNISSGNKTKELSIHPNTKLIGLSDTINVLMVANVLQEYGVLTIGELQFIDATKWQRIVDVCRERAIQVDTIASFVMIVNTLGYRMYFVNTPGVKINPEDSVFTLPIKLSLKAELLSLGNHVVQDLL